MRIFLLQYKRLHVTCDASNWCTSATLSFGLLAWLANLHRTPLETKWAGSIVLASAQLGCLGLGSCCLLCHSCMDALGYGLKPSFIAQKVVTVYYRWCTPSGSVCIFYCTRLDNNHIIWTTWWTGSLSNWVWAVLHPWLLKSSERQNNNTIWCQNVLWIIFTLVKVLFECVNEKAEY